MSESKIVRNPLDLDRLYVFQLIKKSDGSKCRAFVSSPRNILVLFSDDGALDETESYIDILYDVGAVEASNIDSFEDFMDVTMTIPLFSVAAFRRLFPSVEDDSHVSS